MQSLKVIVLVLMYCRCVRVGGWVGGWVSVCGCQCVGGHGMAALQSVGSVGSVGSGWIGSLVGGTSNRCVGA